MHKNVTPRRMQLRAVLDGVERLAMAGTDDRQINVTCTGKRGTSPSAG